MSGQAGVKTCAHRAKSFQGRVAPSRTANCLQAGRFVVDRNRRYVRIRLHLRLVFPATHQKPRSRAVEEHTKAFRRCFRTHIGDFCPRGLIFEKRAPRFRKHVLRAHQFTRVPPPPASYERPGAPLLLLARSRVGWSVGPSTPHELESLCTARYLPSQACSLLAAYRAARLPGWQCRRPPLATSRAQFSARRRAAPTSSLPNLHGAQFSIDFTFPAVAPQTKTLKCPLRFGNGHF